MIVKMNGKTLSPVSIDVLEILRNLHVQEAKPNGIKFILSKTGINLLGIASFTALMPFLQQAQAAPLMAPLRAAQTVTAMSYMTSSAMAPAAGGIMRILDAYVGIATGLCIACVMFGGTAWMLGHRTKAIETLIGASAGMLIIMHAKDYVDWLRQM